MPIQQYIDQIKKRYRTGISREHSYRGDLQNLLQELAPGILVTNEPARVECGAPDYILTKNRIPVGYIEAKDIGADLSSKSYKEQFDRYRQSLSNLIITNYHDFRLYRNGELVTEISIARANGNIQPLADQFQPFQNLITDFVSTYGQTITSAQKLSVMMANKARLMKEIFHNTLRADLDDNTGPDTALQEQYQAFKDILIHDIEPKDFADIYAQTIAYGMFAARLHDPTLQDFSRQEAATLIPKTNPFLRKLFQYIAGYDLDERLSWIVDDLTDIFRATNVAELLKDFGTTTGQDDPMIHFYETFLAEYDPRLRKSRGVWYTPQPVVNFIVRAVDDILKTEFGLKDGLADKSQTRIKVKVPTGDGRSKKGYKEGEQNVHRVQILDPATGTGTFLAEVIRQIYQRFKGQEGIWSQYVDEHLLPRLNGFEILMASYAMAHLKLDLLLTETGYKPQKDQRFRVYLTNSLEEHHPDTGTLFANWLSDEANQANHVKRDTPVMVVLGNPPYSISSSNKGEWIEALMDSYKQGLNERNIQPLSDDYLKFIRYGHHFIEKNGEGVLAYITNNSFLSGIIHRQLRKSLISSFNTIYILDLHGYLKSYADAPEQSIDQNVFDIQQGVSIIILIKHKNNNSTAGVKHAELKGLRQYKYSELLTSTIHKIKWQNLDIEEPYYFFVPKDFSLRKPYESFFYIPKLFGKYNSGIQTEFDALVVDDSESILRERINKLLELEPEDFAKDLHYDSKQIPKIKNAKYDATHNSPKYIRYNYRLFDQRVAVYTGSSNGLMGRPRGTIMKHLLKDNISLIVPKQTSLDFRHSFLSTEVCDANLIASAKKFGCGSVFPLYLYPEASNQTSTDVPQRTPNLDAKLVKEIAGKLGLTFTPEVEDTTGTFAPIHLLDYIYAVLHSPTYREKYKEFLKIDFPRVPYPTDKDKFWKLVELGGQLRQIHLLESDVVEQFITTYPVSGDNTITRKITKTSPGYEPTTDTHGRVWINDEQYFDKVPLVAWEFYIGGYQPAQKWLKDRKGRQLSVDDIMHYQKIIVALTETHRLMQEVDAVGVE